MKQITKFNIQNFKKVPDNLQLSSIYGTGNIQ